MTISPEILYVFCAADQDSHLSESTDSQLGVDWAEVPSELSARCEPCLDPIQRAAANDEIVLDVGTIKYYIYRPGKPFLVAHCCNTSHGKNCRCTKGTYGSTKQNRRGQGRPLGFLLHWLQSHGCSKAAHNGLKKGNVANFADRSICRTSLSDIERGLFFATKCERPPRRGEPLEPMHLP